MKGNQDFDDSSHQHAVDSVDSLLAVASGKIVVAAAVSADIPSGEPHLSTEVSSA